MAQLSRAREASCPTCESAPARPSTRLGKEWRKRLQRKKASFDFGACLQCDSADAPAEREADAAAHAALGGDRVEPAESAQGGTPDGALRSTLESSAGGGAPLPDAMRERLEPRLGADLTDVRVHADGHAHRLATQLGATAFTYGPDIYFRQGAYAPDSQQGRETLAHEVVHTVQQCDAEPAIQRQGEERRLIREHTAWWGDLNEETLGTALLHRARSGEHPFVRRTLYELPWTDRDDVSYALMQEATDVDLVALVGSASGLRLLDQLRDHLIEPPSSSDELAQADRIRGARIRDLPRMTTSEVTAEAEHLDARIATLDPSSAEHRQLADRRARLEEERTSRAAPREELESTIAATRARAREYDAMSPAQRRERRRPQQDLLLQAISAGYASERPSGGAWDPARLSEMSDDQLAGGLAAGFVEGLVFGVGGLAEVIGMIASWQPRTVYELLSDPAAFLRTRAQQATKAYEILSALRALAQEAREDPTLLIQWEAELGFFAGQELARTEAAYVRRDALGLGRAVGNLVGQIVFEVVLELLLAVATEGIGNAVRAALAVGQGARHGGRLANLIRRMVESSPAFRRLIARLEDADVLPRGLSSDPPSPGRVGMADEVEARGVGAGSRQRTETATANDRGQTPVDAVAPEGPGAQRRTPGDMLPDADSPTGTLEPEPGPRRLADLDPAVPRVTTRSGLVVSVADDGGLIVCWNPCRRLRALYAEVLERRPEFRRTIDVLEEQIVAARRAGRDAEVLAGERRAASLVDELEPFARSTDTHWVLLDDGRVVQVEAGEFWTPTATAGARVPSRLAPGPGATLEGEEVSVLFEADRRRQGIVVDPDALQGELDVLRERGRLLREGADPASLPPLQSASARAAEARPSYLARTLGERETARLPERFEHRLAAARRLRQRIEALEALGGRRSRVQGQDLRDLQREARVDVSEIVRGARSDATRVLPRGTIVDVEQAPFVRYAQRLMNELNEPAARLGDGSTAFAILAEQVRGGRVARAVVRDKLHAVPAIEYARLLRRLASEPALPRAARTRLLEEAAKVDEAVGWARRYGQMSGHGLDSLPPLPAWARPHAGELANQLTERRRAGTPPTADELERHAEWN